MESTSGNPSTPTSKQDKIKLRAKLYIARAFNSCPIPTKERVEYMIGRHIEWDVMAAKKKLKEEIV